MANYTKEQFVDLQILVNLLQTPQISEDNVATINKLINRELIKIFDDKATIVNESTSRDPA